MATPQEFVEYRVMKDVISGTNPQFLTQQDRTLIAYRKQVKKVNNNFPIRF